MTESISRAANTLGLELLAARGNAPNAIVSPASLAIALAMLAEGADGDADSELTALLGVSGAERTETFEALGAALGAYGDGKFSLDQLPDTPYFRVANNVVLNEGFELVEDFIASLAEHFATSVQRTDLGSLRGKAVLDEWVRENTAGLIEKSAVDPDPYLRLVLQNALLFAARWQRPFSPGATSTEPFTRADGTQTNVEMMHQLSFLRFSSVEGWKAIELPYSEDFTTYAVLPPEQSEFSSERVTAAIGDLSECMSVDVALPKFDLTAATDVSAFLRRLGVVSIFTDPEGFWKISVEEDIVVGMIAQQARLIVDEAGTVGAAVTEIAMRAMMIPVVDAEFRADRPFIFVVRHVPTGIDVFTAAIGDPSA